MLKFFKVSTVPRRSFSGYPLLLSLQCRYYRCSLCNGVTEHAVLQGRVLQVANHYSTSIPHLQNNDKRKRKFWKKSKYAELLEVSKEKTSEIKTKVKTLNANTLHIINVEELESTSEHLRFEELDEKQTEDNVELEEVTSIPELVSENDFVNRDLSTDTSQIKAESTRTQPGFSKMSKEQREKLARTKLADLEKQSKEKNLNSSLLSYVEVCMSCGFLNRGWYTVNHYLSKSTVPISDIRIFNTLFEGLAQHGKYDRLMDVWQAMTDTAKLQPNSESYARRFEALARSIKRDKYEHLNSCIRAMKEQGISLDELFNLTEWRRDSKETVLGAVRVIRPNFQPPPPRSNTSLQYTCSLVHKLNQPPTTPLVSPVESLLTVDDLKQLHKEQYNVELKLYVQVKSIAANQTERISEHTKFCREQVDKLESAWDKSIQAALARDVAAMCAIHKSLHRNGSAINIYPYLSVLNKSDYVDIIKHEMQRLALGSETFSPTAAVLCREIGNMVRLRYEIKKKQADGILDKVEKIYLRYLDWYLHPNSLPGAYNSRQAWQLIASQHHDGPTLDTESEPWPNTVLTAVGKFLYNIILRDIKVDVNILKHNSKSEHLVPGLYTVFRYQSNASFEEVKPHPVLSRLFRSACLPDLTFSVTDLPMVCPPFPWISTRTGGYLLAKAPIIRLPSSAIAQRERLRSCPPNQLYPCYDALNQLGSIPWRVNTRILDLVTELFNSGGDEKLSVPPPPPPLTAAPPSSSSSSSDPLSSPGGTERGEAYRARLLQRRQRSEMYSLWCDALYRLSLANHFRDRVFWLPHNMDFRGRVYPCPPHLSHLGSDLYRSLLVFANKKPLGPKGLEWLKLHAINLTGLKKRDSISSRLKYADEVLNEIIDSANNPLRKGSWWRESEEPWQTLATCLEIRDALSCPSGPEAHLSNFPIHQDGSCNGLQHYAAIGRDSAGALSVNLAAADLPQDVYSCVAAIVDRERAKDAAAGDRVAAILEGFVRRKVIKQTVMTTVYGVTRYGARLQIAKQLRDIDDFPKEHVWAASQYLVLKTFDSLREMFTSTRQIQDWFTEVAQQISGVRGESVEYLTPLGLPVVQPYSRSVPNKTYYTASGHCSIINKMDKFERPNIMKQKNAFPPNFIHSLDSTHMMLTSLHCERAGITFVSVHDCFWTHPCSVEIMNKICREQFVSLHSQPILEDLSKFLTEKYAYDEDDRSMEKENQQLTIKRAKKDLNSLLRRYPQKGDFELENVLKSVYFFS